MGVVLNRSYFPSIARGAVLFKIAVINSVPRHAPGPLRGEYGYAAFCEELAAVAWVFSASLDSVRS